MSLQNTRNIECHEARFHTDLLRFLECSEISSKFTTHLAAKPLSQARIAATFSLKPTFLAGVLQTICREIGSFPALLFGCCSKHGSWRLARFSKQRRSHADISNPWQFMEILCAEQHVWVTSDKCNTL